MDQPLYLTAVFGCDRDTIAVAEQFDQIILQVSSLITVYKSCKCCVNTVVEIIYAPSDML